MTTYTTSALVRTRIEDIDATLVDADIDQYIYEAEGVIDCILRTSLKPIFDAEKHAIVRSLATDMAALSCLTYNPSEFPSPHIAEMTANLLTDSVRLSYYLLNDPATARFLRDTAGYELIMKVSTTEVTFGVAGQTTLYTVPKGMIFIPTMVVIRAGGNAAATDVTFGRVGALTDWLGTVQLDNLDAAGDQVKIEVSNADPPTKSKTYAEDVVFQIDVTVNAGMAGNYVDLFGYLVNA